eukprot:scaffold102577_cov32-Phaeocystis_antarctica.AAC.1
MAARAARAGSPRVHLHLLAARAARSVVGRVPSHVETKVAQPSASWRSGGLSQHQIVLRAAPSSGQPQLISRLGCIHAAQPYRACARHRCRRRVPAALYACERLQLRLVALLQAPPRPAAAAAAE